MSLEVNGTYWTVIEHNGRLTVIQRTFIGHELEKRKGSGNDTNLSGRSGVGKNGLGESRNKPPTNVIGSNIFSLLASNNSKRSRKGRFGDRVMRLNPEDFRGDPFFDRVIQL